MSGVFQNIDPPPPHRPAVVVGGRTHSLGGEGVGGSIFWKKPDTALYSTYKYFVVAVNIGGVQGVTKRCRLSWLTNSAFAYEPKCRGRGGCWVSANEYSCTHKAQINFGDLTPYLTYDGELRTKCPKTGLLLVNAVKVPIIMLDQ
jgi:hypothetical protein